MDVLMSLGTALTLPLLLGFDVATLRLYFEPAGRTRTSQANRDVVRRSVLGVTLLAAFPSLVVSSSRISVRLFGDSRLQPPWWR